MSPFLTLFLSLLLTAMLSLPLTNAAMAQSLHIGNARVQAGQTANVPVSFSANPGVPVVAFDLRIGYDLVRLGIPSCTAMNGASCAIDRYGRVTILHFSPMLYPLPSSDVAMLHFPVRASALPGTYGVGANAFGFYSPAAEPVQGTVHTGRVVVLGEPIPPRRVAGE